MSSPTPEALHERLSDEQIAYLLSMHRLEPDVAGTRMPWAKDWPLDRLMAEATERLRERVQPSAAPAPRAQEWQPIETAPKKVAVWVTYSGKVEKAVFIPFTGRWVFAADAPQQGKPLPEAPVAWQPIPPRPPAPDAPPGETPAQDGGTK